MSFKDLIKNAIFEEEPQVKHPLPQSVPAPIPNVKTTRPEREAAADTVNMLSPTVTYDNQFYTRLAKQTDLSVVPDLAKIEAFAAPLTSIIADKSLRYKAALATAQSQSGLTKDAILKGFDTLLSVLTSSANSFNKQSDEVASAEVDGKTTQISQLNGTIQQKQKEIADMQQQVVSMQSQVEVSRSKLQQAKTNFTAAYERRKAEILQQRKDFESNLQ